MNKKKKARVTNYMIRLMDEIQSSIIKFSPINKPSSPTALASAITLCTNTPLLSGDIVLLCRSTYGQNWAALSWVKANDRYEILLHISKNFGSLSEAIEITAMMDY